MRQPGGKGYDPRLDRFDVGIRAVVRACRFGQRILISEIGISDEEKSDIVTAAQELTHPLRTEAGVFELLASCPFLLDHALTLLLRYQARTVEDQLEDNL